MQDRKKALVLDAGAFQKTDLAYLQQFKGTVYATDLVLAEIERWERQWLNSPEYHKIQAREHEIRAGYDGEIQELTDILASDEFWVLHDEVEQVLLIQGKEGYADEYTDFISSLIHHIRATNKCYRIKINERTRKKGKSIVERLGYPDDEIHIEGLIDSLVGETSPHLEEHDIINLFEYHGFNISVENDGTNYFLNISSNQPGTDPVETATVNNWGELNAIFEYSARKDALGAERDRRVDKLYDDPFIRARLNAIAIKNWFDEQEHDISDRTRRKARKIYVPEDQIPGFYKDFFRATSKRLVARTYADIEGHLKDPGTDNPFLNFQVFGRIFDDGILTLSQLVTDYFPERDLDDPRGPVYDVDYYFGDFIAYQKGNPPAQLGPVRTFLRYLRRNYWNIRNADPEDRETHQDKVNQAAKWIMDRIDVDKSAAADMSTVFLAHELALGNRYFTDELCDVTILTNDRDIDEMVTLTRTLFDYNPGHFIRGRPDLIGGLTYVDLAVSVDFKPGNV